MSARSLDEILRGRIGQVNETGVLVLVQFEKKILPCAAYLQGGDGISELYIGVPVKLGSKGIEQIIQIKLTPEEKAGLDKSAAAVKELTGVIGV